MGVYDREYMSDGNKKGSLPSWSMTTWLLVVNAAAFIIQHAIFNDARGGGVLLSKDTLFSGQIWRLVTFQFCHANPSHILGNLIFLFFIGRMFQQLLGPRHMLAVYLFGGLAGGLSHIIFRNMILNEPSTVIGASASVLAIATAVFVSIPEQRVNLFLLPIQFKIKYFAWVILGLNVIGFLFSLSPGSGSTVSYISHLGGMAAGWLYITRILPEVKKRVIQIEPGSRSQRSRKSGSSSKPSRKEKKKDQAYLNKKVDAILDKISREGMQSLTKEEKKILEQSSESLSRKLDEGK